MRDNISSFTSALFIGESIWVNIGLAIYEFNTWILIVYFTPAMILVGLLNNCLTLAVFLSRRARTIGLSESLRLYYVALAALDLFTTLHIFWTLTVCSTENRFVASSFLPEVKIKHGFLVIISCILVQNLSNFRKL